MKKFHLLIAIGLIICCLMAIGCDSQKLDTPKNLQIDKATLSLSWDEVTDARFYTVEIEGAKNETHNSTKKTFSLAGLPAGDYEIRVKACGKGEDVKDSNWSDSIPFKREVEPGMAFELINNNTEYEVVSKGVAKGNIVIPATYRDKPVTSIADKAFFNKSDVTGVEIGANIKNIGAQAFANCSYIKSLTIPEGVTTIGKGAFQSCRLLEGEVVIPSTVTSMGDNAFAYCRSITKVTISNGLKSIPASAFSSCDVLSSIVIPNSVEVVGEYAFIDCKEVSSISLGSGLKEIGPYAFANCAKTESVVIPNSVEIIGEGAFASCTALTNVQLGNGVKTIDRYAFTESGLWNETQGNEVYLDGWLLGLKDLKVSEVTILEGTTGIANFAFYGASGIEQLDLPNTVKVIGDRAFALCSLANITIGSGVKSIGVEAFARCKNLSNVMLGLYDYSLQVIVESNLETIESYAFIGCESLSKIIIPNSVKTIGTQAFDETAMWNNTTTGVVYAGNWLVGYNPDKMDAVVEVVDGTVGIANYAFYRCETLTSIVIANTVETIGRSAFYECINLESVTLPSDLDVIEDYTFYHCDALTGIELPYGLKKIGRSAFYKCNLGDYAIDGDDDVLIIPSTVTEIGEFAFYGCGFIATDAFTGEERICGIDKIVISGSVTEIGANAFNDFVSLRSVVLGENVQTIGEKAFFKCQSLEEVVFNDKLVTIGVKAFYQCTALQSVSLPASVVTICDYAFYKCESLKTLDLGSVKNINNYAFYGCYSLTELNIPTTVEFFGKQAFRNCSNIKSVVLSTQVGELSDHVLYGCSSLTIYTDATERQSDWSKSWNSTFRPVVWGCVLSEDDSYVVSFTKDINTITDKNSSNELSAPTRAGYTFEGWALDIESTVPDYTMEQVFDVADGTVLYAVWKPIVTE